MTSLDQHKSTRAEADHLAALLREALLRAGVPEVEASKVRALVVHSGRAFIHLGALRIGSATKLLEALPLAEESAGPPAVPPADAFG